MYNLAPQSNLPHFTCSIALVACGYCIGQCTSERFQSTQKALWNSGAITRGCCSPNYGQWAKSSPIFVNKALLDHRPHPFICILPMATFSLYWYYLNSCYRDCMAHKALNIYSLALHRRNLPTPAVETTGSNRRYPSWEWRNDCIYGLRG